MVDTGCDEKAGKGTEEKHSNEARKRRDKRKKTRISERRMAGSSR